jgi:GNAT superfamily N-acetyltransferase
VAADDKDTPKLSFAEAEALAEKLIADLQPPPAEQFRQLVRDLLLSVLNFVPDDTSVRVRGWWQGMAFWKFIEAHPGVKSIETHPALQGRGMPDPFRRLLAALEEQLAGRQPALLTVKRGEGYQWLPRSPAMARLMAYVAHFAVAMMTGGRRADTFGAEEAAEVVARHLNDAGFDWKKEGGIQSPDSDQRGEGISTDTVTKWRRAVRRRAVDPETLKMFEGLQSQLGPEHKQWSRERRLEWLKENVAWIAGRGAFAQI